MTILVTDSFTHTYTADNPFQSLGDAIAFSSLDWGASRDTAWIYGIICGWDDDDPGEGEDPYGALKDLAARFGWPDGVAARLRGLRAEYVRQTSEETHE